MDVASTDTTLEDPRKDPNTQAKTNFKVGELDTKTENLNGNLLTQPTDQSNHPLTKPSPNETIPIDTDSDTRYEHDKSDNSADLLGPAPVTDGEMRCDRSEAQGSDFGNNTPENADVDSLGPSVPADIDTGCEHDKIDSNTDLAGPTLVADSEIRYGQSEFCDLDFANNTSENADMDSVGPAILSDSDMRYGHSKIGKNNVDSVGLIVPTDSDMRYEHDNMDNNAESVGPTLLRDSEIRYDRAESQDLDIRTTPENVEAGSLGSTVPSNGNVTSGYRDSDLVGPTPATEIGTELVRDASSDMDLVGPTAVADTETKALDFGNMPENPQMDGLDLEEDLEVDILEIDQDGTPSPEKTLDCTDLPPKKEEWFSPPSKEVGERKEGRERKERRGESRKRGRSGERLSAAGRKRRPDGRTPPPLEASKRKRAPPRENSRRRRSPPREDSRSRWSPPRENSRSRRSPPQENFRSRRTPPREASRKKERRSRSRSRSPLHVRDRQERSPLRSSRRTPPRHRFLPPLPPPPPVSHRSRRPSPRRRPAPPPLPPRQSSGFGKPGRNLFVSGFSYHTTEAELEGKFSRLGQIKGVRIIKDKRSGDSRGYGFISMDRDEDADEAIRALDGSVWNNKVIIVEKTRSCMQ